MRKKRSEILKVFLKGDLVIVDTPEKNRLYDAYMYKSDEKLKTWIQNFVKDDKLVAYVVNNGSVKGGCHYVTFPLDYLVKRANFLGLRQIQIMSEEYDSPTLDGLLITSGFTKEEFENEVKEKDSYMFKGERNETIFKKFEYTLDMNEYNNTMDALIAIDNFFLSMDRYTYRINFKNSTSPKKENGEVVLCGYKYYDSSKKTSFNGFGANIAVIIKFNTITKKFFAKINGYEHEITDLASYPEFHEELVLKSGAVENTSRTLVEMSAIEIFNATMKIDKEKLETFQNYVQTIMNKINPLDDMDIQIEFQKEMFSKLRRRYTYSRNKKEIFEIKGLFIFVNYEDKLIDFSTNKEDLLEKYTL